ncbi:transcriptional regulator with XRE-family HTH domain [Lysinibacillus sp. RC79]
MVKNNIKLFRNEAGLTQEQFAKMKIFSALLLKNSEILRANSKLGS